MAKRATADNPREQLPLSVDTTLSHTYTMMVDGGPQRSALFQALRSSFVVVACMSTLLAHHASAQQPAFESKLDNNAGDQQGEGKLRER